MTEDTAAADRKQKDIAQRHGEKISSSMQGARAALRPALYVMTGYSSADMSGSSKKTADCRRISSIRLLLLLVLEFGVCGREEVDWDKLSDVSG